MMKNTQRKEATAKATTPTANITGGGRRLGRWVGPSVGAVGGNRQVATLFSAQR